MAITADGRRGNNDDRDPDKIEVFVCYRTAESSTEAALLARALRDVHVNVCIDFGYIEPGDDFDEKFDQALHSTQLGVGVVLMTANWFERLNQSDNLAKDPVWHEVQEFLRRTDKVIPVADRVAIYSVYVYDIGEPETRLPLCPEDARPEVKELHDQLMGFQTIAMARRGDLDVDDIAASIASRVLRRSLGRKIFDGKTAAEVPPQPLFRLDERDDRRRILRFYADEQVLRDGEKLSLVTLQSQDDLLDRRFDQAVERLRRACDVGVSRHSIKPPIEERAWTGHAANLLVVASLHGQRPRRRQLSEATYLLHDVLVPAINTQADGVYQWSSITDTALRKSVTSVAGLSLVLLWLIWSDYFIERNVLPRENDPGVEDLEDSLQAIGEQLRSSAVPALWIDEELDFLYANYLDGLGASREERLAQQLEDLEPLSKGKPEKPAEEQP